MYGARVARLRRRRHVRRPSNPNSDLSPNLALALALALALGLGLALALSLSLALALTLTLTLTLTLALTLTLTLTRFIYRIVFIDEDNWTLRFQVCA